MYLQSIQPKNEQIDSYNELPLLDSTQKFLEKYFSYLRNKRNKSQAPKIHVNEVSSKLANFYERIRKVIDWKEEHLMRRIAIERILKRRFFLKKNVENLAEPLVLELIRGGHFANDSINKSEIEKVQKIIKRYGFILNNSPALPKGETFSEFNEKIIQIAACEVEETLDPFNYQKVNVLIEYMEENMLDRIVIEKTTREKINIDDQKKQILIYIAVQQALFKLDKPIITYNLFKKYYPEWFRNEEISLKNIIQNIHLIFKEIELYLSHPILDKLYYKCEIYDAPFLLIGDIIVSNPEQLKDNITRPNILKGLISEAYEKRLSTLRKRLSRSAFYSIFSVFLTKILVFYALEIPFAKLVTGHFNLLSSLVNIFLLTLLMAVLVLSIKMPPKNNFGLVMKETNKIVYKSGAVEHCEINLSAQRSIILKFIFGLLYFLSSVISLGVLTFLLYKLHFSIFSYFIFIIFTSVILFTGSVIRNRSRELHMTPRKEGLLNFIIDPFSLPIIYFGRWLSNKWQKYNIISIFFLILIDSPFVLFVEFLEKWFSFLKEKKEEIH